MLLDKNGLTEAEFLARYDASKFERPSVTVDIFLYCPKKHSLLLIKRGGHPFIGRWALPGGFLEMNETVEEAAKRELYEETGVKIEALRQVRVFSDPKRDPRTRVVTVAFLALAEDEYNKAGDDAADSAYFTVKRVVDSTNSESENGTVYLDSDKENIKFDYKKIFPENFVSLPQYEFSDAERISADHAEIIICLLDECERLTEGR